MILVWLCCGCRDLNSSVKGAGEVGLNCVFPGAKSGINVWHQRWLWFAVLTDVCKSRDGAKSAGRPFDKKGWVDVLHGDSDILWALNDLTLLELIKLLL